VKPPTDHAPSPVPGSPLNGVANDDAPPPALLRPPAPSGLGRGSTAPNPEDASLCVEDLLSPNFVRVDRAFDLDGASRGGSATLSPLATMPDEQVVVVELEEGASLITTAGRLRERQEHWLEQPEGTSQRGLAAPGFFRRLYSLTFGSDGLGRDVEEHLKDMARERLGEAMEDVLDISASWLATKLLLKRIEERCPTPPGLYRWAGGSIKEQKPLQADDALLQADAAVGLLVLVHGTGSSTLGSFGELASPAAGVWPLLDSAFGGRIYGFEHHTFSESPIDNALALARSLPGGARLSLVSHDSGGLVADLLCAERLDDGLIDAYRPHPAKGSPLRTQQEAAAAEQREQLRTLRAVLDEKAFHVERYLRVACPARGTRLLGESLDVFLSILLSLLSAVSPLSGQPLLAMLKRLVLEVVRNRLNPSLVPGLAAMTTEAPLAVLLAQLTPRQGLAMATIAGQRQGGHPLQRLARMFSDTLFFQRCPNDLVVDTDAMQAGLASRGGARSLLESGPTLSHFHYFSRPSCSQAVVRWLTDRHPLALATFHPLAANPMERERASTRDTDAKLEANSHVRGGGSRPDGPLPVVVVVPDLMGSHLWDQPHKQRLWFDPRELSGDSLRRLEDLRDTAIVPEKVVDLLYGDLCLALLDSHRVVRFAYDWRQPLDVLAERLGTVLRPLVAEAEDRGPVRLLAHGMGGLVVRGLMAREPDLWQRLITRQGARLLMCGTPNHGTVSIVATLLGQSPMIRNLARLSQRLAPQDLVDLVGGFPGVLQLLPRPGGGAADGGPDPTLWGADGQASGAGWYDATLWQRLKSLNRDRWLGDQLGATATAETLARGRWLWDQPSIANGIPADPEQVVSVHGQAPHTPCQLVLREGRLVILSTSEGDGVVPWSASRLAGIGKTYLMPVDHGNLCCRRTHFPALIDLLREGRTEALPPMPVARDGRDGDATLVPLPAGPVPLPTEEELLRSLVGGQTLSPVEEVPPSSLRVSCQAMDLRYVTHPLMVGHYENDPIAAAEALVDRDIVAGELSKRNRLGLYAGPRGTTTVVLMTRGGNGQRSSVSRGAVVLGLGKLGELSTIAVTEAVRVGTLRYLLQLLDRGDGNAEQPTEVGLASLLIGQNSGTDIHIEDSVTALVEGVLAANEQFAKAFPAASLRVAHLQLIEVYLDTAITATRALCGLEAKLNSDGQGPVSIERELLYGKGWRHRLDAAQDSGYWPRLIVTNVETGGPERSGDGLAAKGEGGRPGVRLADQLRFSFLGQRARAETLHQQRQSGLVEALVAASIQNPSSNEDLSRTLFQLLVPSAFKEVVRHLDQLVLVLDDTTANLPWELLLADRQPLALSLAMVRQLQAPRFRQRLRQATSRVAYVIGNPSSKGFFTLFTGGDLGGPSTALASLDGARREAERVLALLRERDYICEDSIEEENAVDVINKLYRQSYRVLHIAGHGVYEHRTRQGDRRSGVVLADGLLITAAEIEAMEVVPDLVFLNCCHLGTVTHEPVAFNQLAASVARQLIEMGVRAVVACGWAVDDQAALAFAETFYTEMLNGTAFGKAVFLARHAARAVMTNSNTWGAYQAYGDPAYQLETIPTGWGSSDAASGTACAAQAERWSLVTPIELIDQLQQLEVRVRYGQSATATSNPLLSNLADLLKTAPPSWLGKAEVAAAVANVYAAFGGSQREEACRFYKTAIRSHQSSDGLPIRAIEQLANLEARLGEQCGDEPRVRGAIERLQALIRLGADGSDLEDGSAAQGVPSEWQALLGSAYKRLAALRARALLASGRTSKEALQSLLEPLEASIQAYGQASGDLYNQLNGLALEAVRGLTGPADPKAIRQAEALVALVAEQRRGAPGDSSFWNAVAGPDALLVGRLVDRRLATNNASGEEAAQEVLQAYQDVFTNVRSTPLERESVLDQLTLLADLAKARSRGRADPCPACVILSQRLKTMGQALQGWDRAMAPQAEGQGDANGSDDVMETLH
jgi:CHAT domain-containing protein